MYCTVDIFFKFYFYGSTSPERWDFLPPGMGDLSCGTAWLVSAFDGESDFKTEIIYSVSLYHSASSILYGKKHSVCGQWLGCNLAQSSMVREVGM